VRPDAPRTRRPPARPRPRPPSRAQAVGDARGGRHAGVAGRPAHVRVDGAPGAGAAGGEATRRGEERGRRAAGGSKQGANAAPGVRPQHTRCVPRSIAVPTPPTPPPHPACQALHIEHVCLAHVPPPVLQLAASPASALSELRLHCCQIRSVPADAARHLGRVTSLQLSGARRAARLAMRPRAAASAALPAVALPPLASLCRACPPRPSAAA
jgi:hypothetical protein